LDFFGGLADLLDPPSGVFREQPKQQIATHLAGKVDELLYGGAAGGGKTEWLIRYMIDQCERYPGNRCIIFRRVYPSLNRTIIPRAKVILHRKARWNSQDKTFTFPNSSVLEVGSMQYASDWIDYQGAEYGCIGFEEITEFLEVQITEIKARLRSTIPGVRPHMVATTNPGGVGHAWVKRRWVKPKKEDLEIGEELPTPGEVWRPAPREDLPAPPLRAFVPATLQDNPALLKADPHYMDRVLANANRGRRKALSEGDWDAIDAVEGALWTATDLDLGRIRLDWVLNQIGLQRRVIAVDPSDGTDESGQGRDEFGVCDVGLGWDGIVYILGSYAWMATVGTMAKKALSLYSEVKADALVIERNHGGRWMKQVFTGLDPYANIKTTWASDGKRTRAEPVAALFEHNPGSDTPYRARIAGFHEELEDELTQTEFGPGMISPNRLDAMVWGVTDLVIKDAGSGAARRRQTKDNRLRGRR
jgi:hypothetical protein